VAEVDSNPKSIQTIYSWYSEGKLWVNRRYQRKLVWTLEEKQKLIESILRKYPVPAILLAERETGHYEVIDGLQRLFTIISFVEQSFVSLEDEYFDVAQFPTAKTRADQEIFAIHKDVDVLSPRSTGSFLDYALATSVMRGASDPEIDECSRESTRMGIGSATKNVDKRVSRRDFQRWCANWLASYAVTPVQTSCRCRKCQKSVSTFR
jgi:hypothetical protein